MDTNVITAHRRMINEVHGRQVEDVLSSHISTRKMDFYSNFSGSGFMTIDDSVRDENRSLGLAFLDKNYA